MILTWENLTFGMKKSTPVSSPDAYIANLSGWQRVTVERLRAAVLASGDLDEIVKWGHLVYLSNGPVLLIRSEEIRVLFGFWRGKSLREIDQRLKPGGKYEMATIELHENDEVKGTVVRRLVKEAIELNKVLGNPTDTVKRQRGIPK
jgi:hypothetical protein